MINYLKFDSRTGLFDGLICTQDLVSETSVANDQVVGSLVRAQRIIDNALSGEVR